MCALELRSDRISDALQFRTKALKKLIILNRFGVRGAAVQLTGAENLAVSQSLNRRPSGLLPLLDLRRNCVGSIDRNAQIKPDNFNWRPPGSSPSADVVPR